MKQTLHSTEEKTNLAEIYLKPMTPEMYHAYFKEYENDMALYLDKSEFYQYEYSPEKVNAYIERQISKNGLLWQL